MESGEVAETDGAELVHTVAVFLEEVQYFLDDMKRDLWWLLQFTRQPSPKTFVRGDEELVPVEPAVQAMINCLRERAEQHVETHGNQVRARITLIPGVSSEERALLCSLRNLSFHCKGRIEVFLCMKEANNAAIWAAYHNFVAASEPHWVVKTDSPGNKVAFAQCVVVVPVFVNPAKQEIKLLNVWCPEKKKKHWAFPSGDIKRGVDRNVYDAARREFHEEVGIFLGRSWQDCFESELPSDWIDQERPTRGTFAYIALEKDGVRYPCRPHIFARVTEDFYEASRSYEDASGVIDLSKAISQANVDFVRWDHFHGEEVSRLAERVHLEGVAFIEHDEARWVNLEFQTGKLSADDGRVLRRESAELFKLRPERLWAFFADLLGVEPPERTSLLPADFNEDGPFAVRVSGIDKTAQDDDIADFFTEVQVNVTAVRQFDVPKHTARVDCADKESLERALGMSGRALLRRKVKVELWIEAGRTGEAVVAAPGARPLKEYDGPLPEDGPYVIRCRGLDRSVTKDDLGYFFWDRDCQVSDVHFPLKGERHAGIIELKDLESLRRAMSLNSAIFKGREVTIELSGKADIRRDEMSSGPKGGGVGGGFGDGGSRSGKGKGGGKGGGGGGGYGSNREPPSRADFGTERAKLNLKPRSVGNDGEGRGGGGYGHDQDEGVRTRADPFAGARPRDDRFKATRADSDDNWRR